MITILIITHEMLGDAYTKLSQHFFPNRLFNHLSILSVQHDDDHESIIYKVHQCLPKLIEENGVLILTDIFGATPCNAALKLINDNNIAMVTGLNAPMLIKALTQATNYQDVAQLAEVVKEAGLNGIMSFTHQTDKL